MTLSESAQVKWTVWYDIYSKAIRSGQYHIDGAIEAAERAVEQLQVFVKEDVDREIAAGRQP